MFCTTSNEKLWLVDEYQCAVVNRTTFINAKLYDERKNLLCRADVVITVRDPLNEAVTEQSENHGIDSTPSATGVIYNTAPLHSFEIGSFVSIQPEQGDPFRVLIEAVGSGGWTFRRVT